MNFVKLIADTDKQNRRDSILKILAKERISYSLCGQIQNKHWTENIVVSINPQKRRYVIGAHYDNVDGSIGAVDNASGVSVLINLIIALKDKTDKPIDFVFFDREEYEDRGSEAYVNSVGKQNIIAMLNLDPCGYGNTIAVHKMCESKIDWLDNLLDKKYCLEFPVEKVKYTPNGDHYTFWGNGIPTIEVCTVTKELAALFNKISAYSTENEPPKELIAEFINSYDMTTFHNGVNDKLETVSERIMKTLTDFLISALRCIPFPA